MLAAAFVPAACGSLAPVKPLRRGRAPRSIGASAEGVRATPELEWVVLRAFGGGAAAFRSPVDGAGAVDLARRLALLPRLVHATGPERLEAELGREVAQKALSEYRESALSAAKLVALARLAGRVAAANGLQVVALKHAALCLSGVSSPAARGAVDADLLVADADAGPLLEALAGAGIAVSTAPAYEHQHRPLVHPRAGMLELHRHLPGVRPAPGEPAMRFEDVAALGLASPLSAGEPGLLLPRPGLLLAHALAHGLFQHGLEPTAYPAWKLLGDLDDLRRASGRGLLDEALPFVAAEVEEGDARAAWELPALLGSEGAAGVLARREAPEARLLAHLVRGALDPRYPATLKLRNLAASPADRGGLAGLLRNAWHALAIGPSQARVLYGADTPAKYALALAARPFHLAARLVRYLFASRS